MRVIDLGQTGEPFSNDGVRWDTLGLPSKWLSVIETFAPCSQPHDIQVKVLRDCRLLESRRNLIVSGPTNSGKSLLGYLGIFSGIACGRRALLIEPFRALAQEKYDELYTLLPKIHKTLEKIPGIEITTGDYRLNGETLMAEPPQAGEIVIATPERIDAIMRSPEFDAWIGSFGVVCVDEAHLISDARRGSSLENVVTRFLCEKSPPRIILLSATLGNCDEAIKWLRPCDIAESTVRRPELFQNVIAIGENEKADEVILSIIKKELSKPATSGLIFVYRTDDANRLANWLNNNFSSGLSEFKASAYHSKMPASEKASVKEDFEMGRISCLVSTTALGAGINMPVTHVIIRDLTFGTDGPLSIREILQMLGRAGRKHIPGWSAVIRKPNDLWEEESIVDQLRNPSLPILKSAMVSGRERSGQSKYVPESQLLQASKLLLGLLVRREKQSRDEVGAYFNRSLGGKEIRDYLEMAIGWLGDNQRVLAWENEDGVGATTLGKAVSFSGIPLNVGAGIGGLIRDILSLDLQDKILSNWTALDALILLELLDPRERGLKRFSKDIAGRVDAWFENEQMKSVLFTEWIRGSSEVSRADEVLGSLGIELNPRQKQQENARKYAYMAVLRAIVIYQLGNGMRAADVSRRWGIKSLAGVEERWRDHLLWQLVGLLELLDVRCFYYHLRTECNANDDRIESVKHSIMHMRNGVHTLLGLLRFCSPLGPLFRDLESAKTGVGIRTKEKLEKAGIISVSDIHNASIENLRNLGIRRDICLKLKQYIKRRSI